MADIGAPQRALARMRTRYRERQHTLTLDQRRALRPHIASFASLVARSEAVHVAIARAHIAASSIAHAILSTAPGDPATPGGILEGMPSDIVPTPPPSPEATVPMKPVTAPEAPAEQVIFDEIQDVVEVPQSEEQPPIEESESISEVPPSDSEKFVYALHKALDPSIDAALSSGNKGEATRLLDEHEENIREQYEAVKKSAGTISDELSIALADSTIPETEKETIRVRFEGASAEVEQLRKYLDETLPKYRTEVLSGFHSTEQTVDEVEALRIAFDEAIAGVPQGPEYVKKVQEVCDEFAAKAKALIS